MSRNVMNEYIELNQKEIRSYIRLIFSNKFNNEISKKFEELYINVRYYNYYEDTQNLSFKKRLLKELKILEEKLVVEEPNNQELIRKMALFYGYILYFDTISYCKDVTVRIEKLNKLREKLLKKNSDKFVKEFYELYGRYNIKKLELLEKYETKNFTLKINNFENYSNLYKAIIKHNLKMPKLYSQYAIEKAFNTGVTNEDKLEVEYFLISLVVIKDISKGNFKRHYIVEFSATLLKKQKKIKSILNSLNNAAIQDKVSLKISYKEFEENKEEIYELIKEGFKIAIYLDDTFTVNFSDLQKLNVFSYIIISKELKKYEEIMDNKVILNNVVEI